MLRSTNGTFFRTAFGCSSLQRIGCARLRPGSISLGHLGLTVSEILATLSLAKPRDYGDLEDVHAILAGRLPFQLLERNVSRCFSRPGDLEPAEATALMLELRLDVATDESGVVVDGTLNALLYDRAHSPWHDGQPTLANRALAMAAERKLNGTPRPWDVSSLSEEIRAERLRQFCALALSPFRAIRWLGRRLLRRQG